jgi:transcriptional regulator with XRE-family HTH domain
VDNQAAIMHVVEAEGPRGAPSRRLLLSAPRATIVGMSTAEELRVDGAGRPGAARRTELAAFLRARRAEVTPGDVGLPPGVRRRTPGLRREEVALLAGVGVTWYTWLEQGRPINASAQVLDAIARTLGLASAERQHLYHLAEATPLRAPEVAAGVPATARDVLHALAYPAALANGLLDVIDYNAAHRDLFHDWHSMPCIHKNLLWCVITEPRARERFLNYDTEVPFLVARLRAGYGSHVGDPAWEENIARLSRLSPEFQRLWSRQEVAQPERRVRVFRHPDAGDLRLAAIELAVGGNPDLRIVVSTPDDEDTRARLPLIRGARRRGGFAEGLPDTIPDPVPAAAPDGSAGDDPARRGVTRS